MENYNLKENETVLYRGCVTVIPDGKEKNVPKSDFWLTNLNIVIITETKKLLRSVTHVETYSVKDVKIYDEKVQVIRRKNIVDIYMKTGELFLNFDKEKEAKLFCDTALRLISGESKFVRSVKRVKKEIHETDEALNINIAGMAAKSTEFVATATIGIASVSGAGKKTKIFGKIAETFLNGKKKSESSSISEENEQKQLTKK